MRKCKNPAQLAAKQNRIEEIRLLLCENQLTTQQIEYLTDINTNTLRRYLQEMLSNNLIAMEKLRVKGSPGLNLYRITANGKSVKPKPVGPKLAVEAVCNRDCLVMAFFGMANIATMLQE